MHRARWSGPNAKAPPGVWATGEGLSAPLQGRCQSRRERAPSRSLKRVKEASTLHAPASCAAALRTGVIERTIELVLWAWSHWPDRTRYGYGQICPSACVVYAVCGNLLILAQCCSLHGVLSLSGVGRSSWRPHGFDVHWARMAMAAPHRS